MKKFSILFVLIIFAPATNFAQEIEVTQEKMIYKEINGQNLAVHVFYAPEIMKKSDNPVIALFHGGGWVFGSPEEFYEACRRYARKGFVTFSFQYRLSINEDESYPHPEISPIECVKDARSAIRWIRENAKTLKIDPERVVVGGQSAGGQLALSTALLDDINEETDNKDISPIPDALLLFSSCYNTMEAWIDNLLGDRRTRIWDISPYHNLKSDMPPVLAFHGDTDRQVLFYTVLFFYDRMKELGNEYELETFEGKDHYLGDGTIDEEKYARYFDEGILVKADEFLEKLRFMP
jgi:acetyl esterase/lipase